MKQIKKALLAKREKPLLSEESAVSTGSTLLNLACTGQPQFGFLKGNYYYLVGDSASGKTWLTLSCFAESTLNPNFQNYRLIFDDVEGGALMDIGHYFGKDVARRMEAPAYDQKGRPVFSDTIESFYFNIDDAVKQGRPFIYVLDSQDALESSAAAKKFDKQKEAARGGEEAKGSYGDGKAKYHSEHLRHVLHRIRKLKSILIIVGQTRDNLGFGFEKKTRSGGRSLRFYANIEIWTAVGKRIKKMVRGQPRSVGAYCLAEARKNRVTGRIGKDRQVVIPIHYGYGIDDVGSCVDFLILYKHWKKVGSSEKGKRVYRINDKFSGSRNEIIKYIEEAHLQEKLRAAAGRVWQEIEKECEMTGRQPRYV